MVSYGCDFVESISVLNATQISRLWDYRFFCVRMDVGTPKFRFVSVSVLCLTRIFIATAILKTTRNACRSSQLLQIDTKTI